MAAPWNLSFDLGETWIIDHTAYDSDGVTPRDLTGATGVLYVKSQTGAQVLPTAQQSFTLTTPTQGKSRFKVTPAQQIAASISAISGTYVLRFTYPDGTVEDQNYGTFTINATAAV